jgi:hypothetical protein
VPGGIVGSKVRDLGLVRLKPGMPQQGVIIQNRDFESRDCSGDGP